MAHIVTGRLVWLIVAGVLFVGGVALCHAQFRGPTAGEINVSQYPSTQAFEEDLLRRFPKGTDVAVLTKALEKAGMRDWGPVTIKDLTPHVDRFKGQPVTFALYKKDRFLSPDPHSLIIVIGQNKEVVDIIVYH